MRNLFYIVLIILFFLNISSKSIAENNFLEQGKTKYKEKKYEDSKFFFQRSIVFNPKDVESYLYLAKIFNFEENKKE